MLHDNTQNIRRNDSPLFFREYIKLNGITIINHLHLIDKSSGNYAVEEKKERERSHFLNADKILFSKNFEIEL